MAGSSNQIADGHDNIGDLKKFWELQNGLFRRTRLQIQSEWHDNEGVFLNGDRDQENLGKAWAALIFLVHFPAEAAYMRATFSKAVTVRVYHKTESRWIYANAKLWFPDWNDTAWQTTGGYWENARYTFKDLQEITP